MEGLLAASIAAVALLLLTAPGQAAQLRSYYELSVVVTERESPDLLITLSLVSPFNGSNPITAAKWMNVTVILGEELVPSAIEYGTCTADPSGGGTCSASRTDVNGNATINVSARISDAALQSIAAYPDVPFFADITARVVYTDSDGARPRTIQRSVAIQLNYRTVPPEDFLPAALAGLGGAGVFGLALYVGGRARLDELYLMHDSGMLIRHWSRKNGPVHDTDIMSGMFIVLQEFVRDSFADRQNTLEHLRFGRQQVVMVRGKHTWLAAVVRGRYLAGLSNKLQEAIGDFEGHYRQVLENWNGNVELFPSVDIVALRFMKGRPMGAGAAA